MPYLDAVATAQGEKRGEKLFLHLINFHPSESMEIRIRVEGSGIKPEGLIWRIAPDDFMSRNDFGVANVSIARQRTDSLSSDMLQHLPPHSITTIEADIR